MYNFKYDIKEDEETGRPYIHLDEDYALEPEHRFMVMEVAAYSLNDLIMRYNNREGGLTNSYMNDLIVSARMISEISDQLAVLIKEQSDNLDELKNILKKDGDDDKENKDGKDSI